MNLPLRLLLPSALLTAGLNLHASTTGFVIPAFRGRADTEFGLWDNPHNFSVAYSASLSAPGNVVNSDGLADPNGDGNSDAVIRQLAGAPGDVFITGGGAAGNLYSFSIASAFVLSDSNSSVLDTVIFQVRTSGSELDYGSVKLSYDLGGRTQFVTATPTELDRTAAGPGGFSVSTRWEFDLTGLGTSDYAIAFDASASSMSLDSVALDVQFAAVPEPETYALGFGAGLLGFALWRRRASRP